MKGIKKLITERVKKLNQKELMIQIIQVIKVDSDLENVVTIE